MSDTKMLTMRVTEKESRALKKLAAAEERTVADLIRSWLWAAYHARFGEPENRTKK